MIHNNEFHWSREEHIHSYGRRTSLMHMIKGWRPWDHLPTRDRRGWNQGLLFHSTPAHTANSQPFGDWEAEENGTDIGKGRLRKDWVWSGCSVEEEAIFVQ